MRRSRVSGVNKLRRKLRRVEPEILKALQDEIQDGLEDMARDARATVAVDEGDLRDSIEVKMSRDRLTGIVGPGVAAAEIVRRRTGSAFGVNIRSGKKKGQAIRLSKRNQRAYMQMLKGYWNEFGTKGSPKKNIPAQSARPFMTPAYQRNRRRLQRRVNTAVGKALEKSSRG